MSLFQPHSLFANLRPSDNKKNLQSRNLPPGINVPRITAEDLLYSALASVSQDLEDVEHRLKTSLTSKVEGVPEMMAYLIESGGKRIRPLVSCLLARACGVTAKDHITIACVAELLHTATLYHDDVVDNSPLRRGKATANNIFGNKVIVLAGDLMLAHCFSMLMSGGYFPISQALSNTVVEMVEGEILQLKAESNLETTLEQYLEIIDHKTASLFSWCARASAMVAGSSPEDVETLAAFGRHFGLAFQLVDDLMDFVGDRKTMGKMTLGDLHDGKITLPLILGMKHHPSLKKDLDKLMTSPKKEMMQIEVVQKVKQVMEDPLLLQENLAMVQVHLDEARKKLSLLNASVYRTGLISLLEYLAIRER